MKRTHSLIAGLLLAVAAVLPSTAQTNYDAWVTTEGAGLVVHGGQNTPQRPPHYCPHCAAHQHSSKSCKACQKAMKKHQKEMKKHRKEMKKAHKKAHKKYSQHRKEFHRHQ